MKIKGRELRQIIREVLSEGAFDSAAYIAGRIEPAYRPETLEPARPRGASQMPDTQEARVFSLIVGNISELLDNPDVAFIMQQLNSAAGSIARKASDEGTEAAVRSLLGSYERWSQNPAAGRKAPRPLSTPEAREAYKEELRQQFKTSLRKIERMLSPVRGDDPGTSMFGDIDPEELGLDEVRRGRPQVPTYPDSRTLHVVGPYEDGMQRVAYIDPSFKAELESKGFDLQTGEDLADAVREGAAQVWASGMIGGGINPSLTVVPSDVGLRDYPYAFTRKNVKTQEIEVVVKIGKGTYESAPLIYNNVRGSLGRPESLESITKIIPLDLMGDADVPETAADAALDIGFAHRRSSGYREY